MEKCLNKKAYELTKYAEVIEIILICLGIFLVPMVLPQILSALFGETSWIATNSQYVVGTVVNASLIITGINVEGWKKVIGVVTLPSISAMLSGFVFMSATIYTVYMIPAIWLGNFLLVYLYKYLFVSKHINYIISSIVAIAVKVGVIFAGFNILLAANIIPQGSKVAIALTTAMGMNQAVTATLGAIFAFGIMKFVYDAFHNKFLPERDGNKNEKR